MKMTIDLCKGGIVCIGGRVCIVCIGGRVCIVCIEGRVCIVCIVCIVRIVCIVFIISPSNLQQMTEVNDLVKTKKFKNSEFFFFLEYMICI